MIEPGSWLDLGFLALMAFFTNYYLQKAIEGTLPQLRTIPAIAAIEEGVGKSIEEDKPVHYAMGASGGQLFSTLVSMTLTAFAFLKFISSTCARLGARLIVHMPYQTESLPMIEGMVREGYSVEGKEEEFRVEDLRYYGRGALTWTQGVTASYAQEGVGLNLSIGIFYSDCPISLEMAKIMGGMNIGGTGRWIMVYAFAMMCDYVFLGEEIYAAAAVVSQNPTMISGIWVEELGKFFSIGITILGVILALVGFNIAPLLGV
ncbi:MAG: hypothetical protein NWE89_02965 [Candidatus Bathyarchaeota archaeon]|nr:hypothetical protein [Candidatus Bathyarchaeota archaeon]